MALERFRIDSATFLTSLVGGLLPLLLLVVISIISWISLSNLSTPLKDLVYKRQAEVLNRRCRQSSGQR